MDNGAESVSTSQESSRRYSSRGSHSRSVRKIFKLRIAVVLLLTVLVVTIFGWITTAVRFSKAEEEFLQYQTGIRQQVSDSESHSAELERLRAENETLVKGLLPGLRLLEYDTIVTLDDQYVRNVRFTLTGTSYAKNYEYRFVLHNDSLNVIAPSVTLFLFDNRGIQVGTTVLSKNDSTAKVDFSNLQPNETRSYTGTVELNIQSEPKYFLVEVQ